jgi:hypothetical protein
VQLALASSHHLQAKSSEGRVVLISGEPASASRGSRQHFPSKSEPSHIHQDSALYPFIAQLERAAGFAGDDGPETKLDKFAALFLKRRPRPETSPC